MSSLLTNLGAGFRLATFRGVADDDFRFEQRHAIVTIVLATVAWLAGGCLVDPSTRTEILLNGAMDFAVIFVASLLLQYLLGVPGLAVRLAVVLLSLAPFACAGAVAVHLGWAAADGSARTAWMTASAFYAGWTLLVHYRGIEVATGLRAPEALAVYGLYLALSLLPSFTISFLEGDGLPWAAGSVAGACEEVPSVAAAPAESAPRGCATPS